MSSRTNCRLPQTPRTPSSAAAHYFDDVFSRQRRASLGPRERRPTGLARSLTRTRSIGQRSDWSTATSTNGNAEDAEDEEGEDAGANGKPAERSWSIYKEEGNENAGKGEDPDDPINRYVQDQLARIKSNESAEMAEELASQGDGANERKDT